ARRRAPAAGAVLLALACLAAATGRHVDQIGAGRLELWSTATPMISLLGHGAGSSVALAGGHLHNDFLERLFEQGIAGLGALLFLIVAALKRAPLAIACALAALCARALVDFPLARPAELCLFVVLVACAFHPPEPEKTP